MWPSSKQLKFELSSWLKPFLTFSKKDRDRFKRKSIQKNEKNKLRTHKNVTENEFCFVEVTYDGLFIFQNSPKLILQSQDELRNLFKLTLLLRPFSGSSNWEFELSEKQTKQNRDVLEPFSAENLTLSRNANVSHSNRQLELRIVWEKTCAIMLKLSVDWLQISMSSLHLLLCRSLDSLKQFYSENSLTHLKRMISHHRNINIWPN